MNSKDKKMFGLISNTKDKKQSSFGSDINFNSMTVGLLVIVLLLVVYNVFEMSQIKDISGINKILSKTNPVSAQASNVVTVDYKAGDLNIMPKGVPNIYGKELGVNFDDVSPLNPNKANTVIGRLGSLDDQIELTGNDLSRYISIASQISCEYCCGAKSIIFDNGKAACGCAHSYAMRGLAKYLIKNHGSEYKDDEILSEMGKWKVLFFPTVHQQKAQVLKDKGIELNYVNLASNKYRGIEKGTAGAGSMVGGC